MSFTDLKTELATNRKIQFYVRVVPNAAKTYYKESMSDGSLKIAIAAVPEKGKANSALVHFLAQEFSVPKVQVQIVSGAHSRMKLVRIEL